MKSYKAIEIDLEFIPGEPTLEQQHAHKNFWDWYFAQIMRDGGLNQYDNSNMIN